MGQGQFYSETWVADDIDSVWQFFSTAENLAKITTFPKVKILSNPNTTEGNMIKMKLHFGLFQLSWDSEIIEVKEKQYFIDVGKTVPFPFKQWKHIHSFEERENFTLMKDNVQFNAAIANPLVHLFLTRMFNSRKKEIEKNFKRSE